MTTDVGYEDVCIFLWCIANVHEEGAATSSDQSTDTKTDTNTNTNTGTNRRQRASGMDTMTAVTKKKRTPRSNRRRTINKSGSGRDNRSDDSGDVVFSVERILAHRVTRSSSGGNGVLQYLVKWEGFDNRYNRWVASTDMFCDELMAEYHSRCAGKRGDRRRRQK